MALILKSNNSASMMVPSDMVDYNILPKALGVYATNRLVLSYKGALIKVVNDQQQSVDIYPNRDGSIDALDLVEFANGGDLRVSHIYNQTGMSDSASRSDAAYQPLIVKSGVVVTNRFGQPALLCENASGLVDRGFSNYNINSSFDIFFDVEPKLILSEGNKVFTMSSTKGAGQGYSSTSTTINPNGDLAIYFPADMYIRKETLVYGGGVAVLPTTIKLDFLSKNISTISNNIKYQKSIGYSVGNFGKIDYFSIASAGSSFKDADSFNGIISQIAFG